jgi:hypothetical protein
MVIPPAFSPQKSARGRGDDSQFDGWPLVPSTQGREGRMQHQFLEDPEGWIDVIQQKLVRDRTLPS